MTIIMNIFAIIGIISTWIFMGWVTFKVWNKTITGDDYEESWSPSEVIMFVALWWILTIILVIYNIIWYFSIPVHNHYRIEELEAKLKAKKKEKRKKK